MGATHPETNRQTEREREREREGRAERRERRCVKISICGHRPSPEKDIWAHTQCFM